MKKLLVWLLCVVLIATNVSSLVYAEPVVQSSSTNGWVSKNGKVSYYDNGQLVTGWFTDYNANLTYFFNTTGGNDYGTLVTGWQIIDNKQCYFNPYSNGELLVNTVTPDGSIVNSNGVKVDATGNEIFVSGGMSSNGSIRKISPNDKSKDNLVKTFETLSQITANAINAAATEAEKKNQTSLLNFFQTLGNTVKQEIQKRDALLLNNKSNQDVSTPLVIEINEQAISVGDKNGLNINIEKIGPSSGIGGGSSSGGGGGGSGGSSSYRPRERYIPRETKKRETQPQTKESETSQSETVPEETIAPEESSSQPESSIEESTAPTESTAPEETTAEESSSQSESSTEESTAPTETTAPEETTAAEDTEEGVIANFKSQHITASMTEFQKEIEIVKWLVKNVDYDYANLLAGTVPAISHESAGALLNKVCVCDGYSKAFIKMAQACGIEAEMRTGWAGENHAWNQVKLDGDWYNLDVTWEDPIVNGEPNHIYGDKLYGKYINLTNEQIHLDHTCQDGNERSCTATKYNNNTSSYYVLSGNIVENLQSDDYRMLIMKNNAYTYSDFPGGDWLFDDRRNEWTANDATTETKIANYIKDCVNNNSCTRVWVAVKNEVSEPSFISDYYWVSTNCGISGMYPTGAFSTSAQPNHTIYILQMASAPNSVLFGGANENVEYEIVNKGSALELEEKEIEFHQIEIKKQEATEATTVVETTVETNETTETTETTTTISNESATESESIFDIIMNALKNDAEKAMTQEEIKNEEEAKKEQVVREEIDETEIVPEESTDDNKVDETKVEEPEVVEETMEEIMEETEAEEETEITEEEQEEQEENNAKIETVEESTEETNDNVDETETSEINNEDKDEVDVNDETSVSETEEINDESETTSEEFETEEKLESKEETEEESEEALEEECHDESVEESNDETLLAENDEEVSNESEEENVETTKEESAENSANDTAVENKN